MHARAAAFVSAVAELVIAPIQAEASLDQLIETLPNARTSIFFDEEVPLIVLLRLKESLSDEDASKLAAGITINVDATVSEVSETTDASATRKAQGQLVYSELLDTSCFRGLSRTSGALLLIWSIDIFIPFVKTSTAASRASFSVTLNHDSSADDGEAQDLYILNDGEDDNFNILQSLCNDAELGRYTPHLSAKRLLTLQPVPSDLSTPSRSKKHARRTFPCKSAIALRIKSTLLSGADRALVTLDIEATLENNNDKWVVVDEIVANTADGGKLTALGAASTPIKLRTREQLALVFELSPSTFNASATAPVDLSMLLRPQSSIDGLVEGPKIRSKWATMIRVRQDPLKAEGQRPSSQLMSPKSAHATERISHRFSTQTIANSRQTSHPFEGIHLTLTAPSSCHLGETVTLSAALTNQTTQHKALLIQVPSVANSAKQLPKLPPQDERRSSGFSFQTQSHSQLHSNTQLMCLSSEARVGSLAPTATRSLNLHFVALATGTISLRDLRIIDLQTNQAVDVEAKNTLHVMSA